MHNLQLFLARNFPLQSLFFAIFMYYSMVKISNYQKITEKRVIFKNIMEMIRTWAISGLILTLLRLIFSPERVYQNFIFCRMGRECGFTTPPGKPCWYKDLQALSLIHI